jgi:hypothetical protein
VRRPPLFVRLPPVALVPSSDFMCMRMCIPKPQPHRNRKHPPGGARGVATAVAPNRLQLRLEFDDPHGGVNVDEFEMPSPDELVVTTVVTSGGETAEFKQVYSRRK